MSDVKYSPERAAALAREALADEERMTNPWEVGPYYGRDGHGFGDIVHDVLDRSGPVIESLDLKLASAVASMRNRNLELAQQLIAAGERVVELERAIDRMGEICRRHISMLEKPFAASVIQQILDEVKP